MVCPSRALTRIENGARDGLNRCGLTSLDNDSIALYPDRRGEGDEMVQLVGETLSVEPNTVLIDVVDDADRLSRRVGHFHCPGEDLNPRLWSGTGFRRPTALIRILAMGYSTGNHTVFHHCYHIVWAPKYRFKVLHGEVRVRVREIIQQICSELGVTIINGALSHDHVHMFVEIPPHVSVSDFVRRDKGRSSRKIQQEFEHIRKRYWGQRSWARGYFSTTSGNITDDVIMNYLDKHTVPNSAGFSPKTGVSRLVVQCGCGLVCRQHCLFPSVFGHAGISAR